MRRERGSVSAWAVVTALLAIAALALVAGMGTQMAVVLAEDADIQIAREEISQAGAGLEIKNAKDPGRDLAARVVRSVRAQGFDGEVEVWFWEAPRGCTLSGSSLPAGRRSMTWCARLTLEYPSVLSAGGEASATASEAFTLSPFADGTAWMPCDEAGGASPEAYSGLYRVAAGEGPDEMEFTRMGLDEMPQGVRGEALRALSAIAGKK